MARYGSGRKWNRKRIGGKTYIYQGMKPKAMAQAEADNIRKEGHNVRVIKMADKYQGKVYHSYSLHGVYKALGGKRRRK